MNVINKDHDLYQYINLNKNNYQNGGFYRYTFPVGSVNLKNTSIALESMSMQLSYYNITTALNNRIFTIGFPEGGSYVYNQITIDEGKYNIQELNAWLQWWMISQNYYLIDDLGNYRYYVEIAWNPTKMRVQLNLYNVPTVSEFALLTGWTNPGWSLPTVSGRRPIFVVGESNDFYKIIGFEPNGLGYNDESQLGQFAPIDPIDTIIVQCSNLDNFCSDPSINLYAFNTKDGSNNYVKVAPIQCNFIDLSDGRINYIDIRLVDINLNPIVLKDENIKINLIMKIRQII